MAKGDRFTIERDKRTVAKYWLVDNQVKQQWPIHDDILLRPIRILISIANKGARHGKE